MARKIVQIRSKKIPIVKERPLTDEQLTSLYGKPNTEKARKHAGTHASAVRATKAVVREVLSPVTTEDVTTKERKAEYKLFRYRHEIDLLEKSMESKAWKDDQEYQKTVYDSAYKLLVTLTGAREGSALLETILGAQPQDIPEILATEKSDNPALWEVREDVKRLCEIRKKIEANRAAQLKSKAVEKSRMLSTSEVHIPPNPFHQRPTAIGQVSKVDCSFLKELPKGGKKSRIF